MSVYALTPLAKTDIFAIWAYIVGGNEDAAGRVEQAIYDAWAFLAEAPRRGHSRPDFTDRSLRFWTLTAIPTTPLCIGQKRFPFRSLPSRMGKEIFGAF